MRGDNVGLEPEDCFALVTYKINNAVRRQTEERLPYVFLVLSVPELNANEVAKLIPDDYVWTLAVLEGKRSGEEAMVDRLRAPDHRRNSTRSLSGCPKDSSGFCQRRKPTTFYGASYSNEYMRFR